jgi:hypothetical protein
VGVEQGFLLHNAIQVRPNLLDDYTTQCGMLVGTAIEKPKHRYMIILGAATLSPLSARKIPP